MKKKVSRSARDRMANMDDYPEFYPETYPEEEEYYG